MKLSLTGLLLLSFFVAGCSQVMSSLGAPTSPIVTEQLAITNTAPAPTSAASASETPEFERVWVPATYRLDAELDYANHVLKVTESIEYTNNSSDSIEKLQLVVEAQRLGAGFTLQDMQSLSGPQIGSAQLAAGLLSVPLLSPLVPGDSIRLEIKYELYPSSGSGMLSWSERQTNFIDWYPYLPPYHSGEGWLTHSPAAVGEHTVFESADFSVRIEVSNAPASLQIAGPAPAVESGVGWDYTLNSARRFIWSTGPQYEVLRSEQNGIPISVYVFGEHVYAGQDALETAARAIAVYEPLFGPYPYESLSIVEALFFDGMESDGLFFLSADYFQNWGTLQNYLTTLTAHEVAHNWWFGQVGNDQALAPWLDEALATYSELLYYENAHPNLVSWWWNFRINRYDPVGWVDTTIYEGSDFLPYVGAVYRRGAQFLQEVRTAMGDEAFFAFLREYVGTGTTRIMTTKEFLDLLNEHSPVDLTTITDKFFRPRDDEQ